MKRDVDGGERVGHRVGVEQPFRRRELRGEVAVGPRPRHLASQQPDKGARRRGRLEWGALFDDARAFAERGIVATHALVAAIARNRARLEVGAAGWPALSLAAGARWHQPELASVLAEIAASGSPAVHEGRVAATHLEKALSIHRRARAAAGEP